MTFLPRFLVASACLLSSLFAYLAAPALAVPEEGVYGQYGTDGVLDLQTVAYHGAVQVDYVPSMSRFSGGGTMQVLRAAARFPAPIIESALTVRALLGYQQQWAYYNGLEDTYGGIDIGLSSSLNLDAVPYVGEFLRPVTLYGYGFLNRLVTAKANGQSFDTNNELLPTYGYGVQIQVPTKGYVYAGIESSSVPIELGSGATSFSNKLYTFNQYVLGYRW